MLAFLNAQLASWLRGGLKFLSGWLIGHAILDSAQAETFSALLTQIILGALPFVAGQIWTWMDQRFQKKVVEAALVLPPTATPADAHALAKQMPSGI